MHHICHEHSTIDYMPSNEHEHSTIVYTPSNEHEHSTIDYTPSKEQRRTKDAIIHVRLTILFQSILSASVLYVCISALCVYQYYMCVSVLCVYQCVPVINVCISTICVHQCSMCVLVTQYVYQCNMYPCSVHQPTHERNCCPCRVVLHHHCFQK